MLSIGDGIAIGCAILATVIVVWKFLSRSNNKHNPASTGHNPTNKYVLQKVFDTGIEATNRQLETLNNLVTKGFEELRGSIRSVHGRIDDLYGSKTKRD